MLDFGVLYYPRARTCNIFFVAQKKEEVVDRPAFWHDRPTSSRSHEHRPKHRHSCFKSSSPKPNVLSTPVEKTSNEKCPINVECTLAGFFFCVACCCEFRKGHPVLSTWACFPIQVIPLFSFVIMSFSHRMSQRLINNIHHQRKWQFRRAVFGGETRINVNSANLLLKGCFAARSGSGNIRMEMPECGSTLEVFSGESMSSHNGSFLKKWSKTSGTTLRKL